MITVSHVILASVRAKFVPMSRALLATARLIFQSLNDWTDYLETEARWVYYHSVHALTMKQTIYHAVWLAKNALDAHPNKRITCTHVNWISSFVVVKLHSHSHLAARVPKEDAPSVLEHLWNVTDAVEMLKPVMKEIFL